MSKFWESNVSFAEAARMLGVSRQNISQCVQRGSIPCVHEGKLKGISEEWVLKILQMRNRDKETYAEAK